LQPSPRAAVDRKQARQDYAARRDLKHSAARGQTQQLAAGTGENHRRNGSDAKRSQGR